MGTPGPSPEVTLEDTLRVVAGPGRAPRPFTTPEVAEAVGCARRTAHRKLQRLAERGEIETKKVGASGRVWWATATDPGEGEGSENDRPTQFEEFVREVKDYAIFTLDPEGHVSSWNAGAERIKGFEPDDIIGEHFSAFYTADEQDEGVPSENLEAARTDGRVEDEGWRVRADGSRFWANVVITAIRDDDGELKGFTKVTRDLTERREWERKLEQRKRELETELGEIMGRISDGFYAIDDDWRLTHVNERAEEILQQPAESIVGESLWEVLTDGEEGHLAEQYREAVETMEAVSFEHHDEAADVWLQVSAYPSETGLSVYFRDITARVARDRVLERYERIVETIQDGVYTVDSSGRFSMVNAAYAEMVGYDREALLGEPVSLVVDDETAAAAREIEAEIGGGERETARLEADVLRADGETVRAEATFAMLPGDDGHQRVGVVRDITERVERERALEESERRYRTLVENFPNGAVTLFDEDLRFVAVGGENIDTQGQDAEALEGQRIEDVVPAGLAEQYLPQYRAAVEDGERHRFEVEYEGRHYQFRALPVRDAEGEVLAGMGVSLDVTERVERERELEESEELYRTLIENVPAGGIGLVDRDLRYEVVGGEVFELVGLSPEEVAGSRIETVYDDTLADRLSERYRAALEGESSVFELSVGGHEVEMRTVPVRDADGEVFAALGMSQDITERKARERQLERYETIVETVDDGIYALDDELRFTMVNEGYAEMVGYDRAELLGAPVSTVVDDADVEMAEELREQLRTGELAGGTVEVDVATASGGTIPTETAFAPLWSDGETFAGTVGIVRDITERKERERTLRRYETLIEESTDVNAILDPDGTVEYVTPSVEYVLGYEADELVGENAFDYLHPDDREPISELFGDILGGAERPPLTEFRFRHADGSWVWLEARTRDLRDDPGVDGVVVYTREVTDRKAYEFELQQFETLIEESTDVNLIVDPDGRFRYLPPSTDQVLGYDAEALEGEIGFEYVHPDDVGDAMAEFNRAIEDPDYRASVEFRFEHADGSWIWLEARARNLLDDPVIDGIVVYTRDVTERKAYERQLEARANQQSVIAELGHYALENPDLDDLFVEASRRLVETLDANYCEVLELDADAGELRLRQGMGWRDGYVGHHAVPDDEGSQAGYTLGSSEPVVVEDLEAETRFQAPELLTDHGVSSGVTTHIGATGEAWGILGVHDTATRSFTDDVVDFVQSVANVLAEAIERQRYQDELEELVAELEVSNERLEQFAYVASHDLREPLRMVTNYLQLLEDRFADELDDDAEEFIEFAVVGAERMRAMINGLLSYSRVDTEAEPFEPVDCNELVEQVRRNVALRIEEADATVHVGDLPTVHADENQLAQVLQNLLSNAIKYRDGPPSIEIDAERAGDDWVFRVADDGIGMDPDQAETVFEVFQRLHTHEEYSGTGIGLALCEKIVERHGGEIWVDSAPGEGSTFYFTIPASVDERVAGPGDPGVGGL